MTLIEQLIDEFWSVPHAAVTSPVRMRLVMARIARAIAQDCPAEGSAAVSEWLLDQMVGAVNGEAPLNRRTATQDRRQREAGIDRWIDKHSEWRRSTIRRSTDPTA